MTSAPTTRALRRPHPPILIGGPGEKKTLPLVARYAGARNLFAAPGLARKLDVLHEHCEAGGRGRTGPDGIAGITGLIWANSAAISGSCGSEPDRMRSAAPRPDEPPPSPVPIRSVA